MQGYWHSSNFMDREMLCFHDYQSKQASGPTCDDEVPLIFPRSETKTQRKNCIATNDLHIGPPHLTLRNAGVGSMQEAAQPNKTSSQWYPSSFFFVADSKSTTTTTSQSIPFAKDEGSSIALDYEILIRTHFIQNSSNKPWYIS